MEKSILRHGKIGFLNMFYLTTGAMFLVFEELPRTCKVDYVETKVLCPIVLLFLMRK
jgi:hypothetical protein